MVVLFVAFMIGGYWFYLITFPASHWFEYTDVEPAQSSFVIGEELRFVSHSAVYREVDMTWHDILRCRFNDERFLDYGQYSEYKSSATALPAREIKSNPSAWTYSARIPTTPAVCVLDTTVTVDLPFHIKKTQKLQGQPFKFIYPVK
jgi:hypothetical protein